MKIFDCFIYNDEDLILELRFNILDKFVHKFIVIEAKFDHQNNPKKTKSSVTIGLKNVENGNCHLIELFLLSIAYVATDVLKNIVSFLQTIGEE